MQMQKIAAALVKAQKGFSPALKTSSNPHFRSKYADLSACVEAVIDSLNDSGIALIQMTHECQDGVTVETVFVHDSGEMLSAGKLHVPAAKHDPQGYGSALTYARRYSLMAACGIAPEDDDGNAATKVITPRGVINTADKPAEKPKQEAPKVKPLDEDSVNFLMDHYLAFLPEAKTSKDLTQFWKDNAESAKRIEQEDPDRYIELLGAFKKRKDELSGESK
jgi:hypothetical protein